MTTKIQWCSETWNPVVGCSRISEGCKNCYAAELAKSPRLQQFPQYQKVKNWDGTVEFVESQLLKPLSWKSPKMIFPSMSDLFHKNVPDEWRDRVFAVIAIAPWHTYQILTKNPDRMKNYFTAESAGRVYLLAHKLLRENGLDKHSLLTLKWPLKQIWLGVSVENQRAADLRIPLLLEIPAKKRFLSCEPLLEAVNLWRSLPIKEYSGIPTTEKVLFPGIDWVIAGGESGAKDKVRVCHISWLRSLILQCQLAQVPIFIKQLGTLATDGHTTQHYLQLKDRKGGEISEWPRDLRIREFPHHQ